MLENKDEQEDEDLPSLDNMSENEDKQEDEEVPNLDNVLKDEDNHKDDNQDDSIEENILDDEDELQDKKYNDDDDLDEIVDEKDNEDNAPKSDIDNSEENSKIKENMLKGIDDIINDNNEGDILISHGSILEDEIAKKEEDYFSSSDAFNFSLNKDFLLGDYDDEENNNDDQIASSHNFAEDYDDGEVIKPASEKDTFDTEDLIDKDLYDPEEVPRIPDDFYREAEEKVKENMTAGWKNILKSIRGKKFVNKNMNDMLNWVKEQSGLDIKHAAMLTRQDDGVYKISESQNLSDDTKEKLNITEDEAIFKKILSHKKTLYVSDPFSSDSLKNKFGSIDRENISHMIFVPVENDEGCLKSFFIGLSAN